MQIHGIIGSEKVTSVTLKNKQGNSAVVTNYGARLVSWNIQNKAGKKIDIVLGFKSLEEYLKASEKHHGAIIGRYGNRIANGQFQLQGKTYQCPINLPPHHLHGGKEGFHHQVWKIKDHDEKSVTLSHDSPDGHAGYPGNLHVEVNYHLRENNELEITYCGHSDKETVINLTHHSYFNLDGEGYPELKNHYLRIHADEITGVDDDLIPDGSYINIVGTPLDFTLSKPILRDIDADIREIRIAGGYDHNYVLSKKGDSEFRKVAHVYSTFSGLVMEVFTTEPGLQFYSANWLDGSDIGKSGKPYVSRSAFCLETQHFPDSPHHDHFPTTILKPNVKFSSKTSYKVTEK